MQKKFIELGMDSIIVVEWINALNRKYHISLKATNIYDYPTIGEFIQFIFSKLEGKKENVKKIESTPKETKQELEDGNQMTLKEINEKLIKEFASVLEVDVQEISVQKQFIDMGLDSILAIEWIQRLNKLFALNIKTTKIYDYPTIQKMADYIYENFGMKVKPEESRVEIEKKDLISDNSNNQRGKENKSSISYELLMEKVVETVASVLDISTSDVDVKKKFIDMGMDSILMIEWIQNLNKALGTQIKATKVYDYPTVESFATFISKDVTMNEVKANDTVDDILFNVLSGDIEIEKANKMLGF